MTIGQIVFYSGIALLLITVFVAIIFQIRKPQYTPEITTHIDINNKTMRFHNGYPTDPLTKKRPEHIQTFADSVQSQKGTVPLDEKATEPLKRTEKLEPSLRTDSFETESLRENSRNAEKRDEMATAPLKSESHTAILQSETTPVNSDEVSNK